ncbi:hypothetical protein Bca52824_081300 [Brassica carinata]|uniref:Uncharacterized protein n=1 Tax=Brassica carinata TaxID=52824 RepID=A0A8X7PEY3_BRACI|nr:hypothetical protein Bca52824_081300 [Brassica carinata]
MTSETEEETFTKEDLNARDGFSFLKKVHFLMAGSMTNRRAQVVDGDAQVSVLETSQHKKGIEIMNSQLSKGGISGILDKISHADREESQGVSWSIWYEAQFI